MLTLLHPEVVPLLHDLSMGLLPLWFKNDDRPKLVIKAPKEALLAAKLNHGFKIYAAPVTAQNKRTMGLVTAFFDVEDEPLVTFTPMFAEPWVQDLKCVLLSSALDIHFFDDNNRELLGYEANIQCSSGTRDFIEHTALLSFDIASARSSLDQMAQWFGLRTVNDDCAAISVILGASLFPEDIFIQDLRPENHSYQGSQPFSFSQLVRQEPGPFQERDIVQLLHRVFSPEQIYLGPLRVTDREEIADVLVVTKSRALFIQAKDSPNTEEVLRNPIRRKKATAKKSLTKAVDQVRGALRYAKSMVPMKMLVGGKEAELMLEGLELRALIVVKELFNDEYSIYSPAVLSLAEQTQVPCIALDYTELHMYTANLSDEDLFFEAYDVVFTNDNITGAFPRLRFGLSGSDWSGGAD